MINALACQSEISSLLIGRGRQEDCGGNQANAYCNQIEKFIKR